MKCLDCDKPARCRDYCSAHYEKYRSNGKLKVKKRKYVKTNGKCKICDEKHFAYGYCEKHRYLFEKYGDPNADYKHKLICIIDECDEPHDTRIAFCNTHLKIKETILKEKHECKCGCGKLRLKYDKKFRIKNYISGHQPKGKNKSNTKPERFLKSILSVNGINYESQKPIIGKPDIFIQPNICIFEDGCYYHGCEEHLNEKELLSKIPQEGIRRDQLVTKELKKQGYKVVRIWEHEVYEDIHKCLKKMIKYT